jgi:hypothetical protein
VSGKADVDGGSGRKSPAASTAKDTPFLTSLSRKWNQSREALHAARPGRRPQRRRAGFCAFPGFSVAAFPPRTCWRVWGRGGHISSGNAFTRRPVNASPRRPNSQWPWGQASEPLAASCRNRASSSGRVRLPSFCAARWRKTPTVEAEMPILKAMTLLVSPWTAMASA